MIGKEIALSWMVLSPISFISDIASIIVISHYFPFFHGSDVTLISMMVAMAGNAMFVLPIPAYMELRSQKWTSSVCIGYAWCILSFRMAQILSLMVLSIHWSTLLKMSTQNKKYFSTKFLKITVVFIWITSAIFGLLPLIGVANDDFDKDNSCKFLAYNIGNGYGIYFFIVILTAMFVSVLCATDAMIIIKHIKIIAKTKYQAGRFHLPDRRSDLPVHGSSSLAERYHRLQFAWDLSKFSLAFVLISFAMNHFPYAIIQGVQLFTQTDRAVLEVISIYLVGFEALLLPHTLWLLSRRYRHALVYQWQVYVLRNKDKEEEEPNSCTLQSYIQKERDRISLVPSRPPSGHASVTGTLKSVTSETPKKNHTHVNGQTNIHTISKEGSKTVNNEKKINGVIHGEVHVERPPSIYDERPIDIEDLELHEKPSYETVKPKIRKISEESSISIKSEQGKPPTSVNEVVRSSSARTRRDWKERMRKKHLPPIFVNEAFDDKSPTTYEVKKDIALSKQGPANISGNSLHFYMSSDYHPDYLTDSLPRRKLNKGPSSESEMGEPYKACDIDEVLDNDSITDIQVVKAKAAFAYSDGNGGTFSSFKSVPKVNTHKNSQNVYNTFEDLSQMFLREDRDIEMVPETIQLSDDNDGYSSLKANKTKSDVVSTITFLELQRQFSSFKYQLENRNKKQQSLSTNPFADYDVKSTSFEINKKHQLGTKLKTLHNANVQSFIDTCSYQESVELPFDKNRPHVSNTLQINDQERNERNSQYSLGESTGFSVTDIEAANRETNEFFEKNKTIADNDNQSKGINGSVTIIRYDGEARRKPWMEDFDVETDEHSQIGEPLVIESDTDTLRDSHDSSDFRYGYQYNDRYLSSPHSDLCTPVSSFFDEETDKGFEEALEMHVNANANVYGGVGLCFESIEEEPEELNSSSSNPFLDHTNTEDRFRTQAVVSRSSNSRTSSSASASDTQLNGSPDQKRRQGNPFVSSSTKSNSKAPRIVTEDFDNEFGDSGFASGLERGNSDSSSHRGVSPRGRNSPWPDEELNTNMEKTFESDFCGSVQQQEGYRNSFETRNWCEEIDGSFSKEIKGDKNKTAVNKLIQAVKYDSRPHPMRVKSLERTSPHTQRKLPRRGHSFEEPKINVKPAYF